MRRGDHLFIGCVRSCWSWYSRPLPLLPIPPGPPPTAVTLAGPIVPSGARSQANGIVMGNHPARARTGSRLLASNLEPGCNAQTDG